MLCATVAVTREVYVRPSSTTACPICYTLEHILQNPSQYLIFNTRIIFLAGVYEISMKSQVVITNVSNLSFIGSASRLGQLHSRIKCTSSFGLAFINSSNISIAHLGIERCGTHFTEEALQSFGKHSMLTVSFAVSAAVTFMQVTSLSISGVSIMAPNGYGLWATNIFNSNITGSTFSNSTCGNLQLYYTDSDLVRVDRRVSLKISTSQFINGTCNSSSQYGCGLSIVLLQLLYSIDIELTNITTSNNWARNGANIFLHGNGCTKSTFRIEKMVSMYGGGSRGTGLLFQWGSYPFICTMWVLYKEPVLYIEGSYFMRNTAYQGVVEISVNLNPSLEVSATSYLTVFRNSSIAFNRVTAYNTTAALLNFTGCETSLFQDVAISHNSYNASAWFYSTMYFLGWNQVILGVYKSNERSYQFTCHNCNFSYNTNGTVLQVVHKGDINFFMYFHGITTFTKNVGARELVFINTAALDFNGTTTLIGNRNGAGIRAMYKSYLHFAGNTTFKKFLTDQYGAAIFMGVMGDLNLIGNTHFEDNEAEAGGAIAAFLGVNVYTTGNLTFLRNRAKYGGAMMIQKSGITMKAHIQIRFSYNTASLYGGAIFYVPGFDLITIHGCFMQLLPMNATTDNIRVTYIYNEAGIAGSALYGGSFDTCLYIVYSRTNNTFAGTNLIKKFFHFVSNKSDISVVSSEPYRVCICEDNQPQCQILEYNTTVYPGEMFTLSLIGVGQMLGAVPATVHAELLSNHHDENSHSLGELQDAQLIFEPKCTAVNYSVYSSDPTDVLVLKVATQRPTSDLSYLSGVYKLAPDEYKYWHHSVNINLTLAPCPPGFTLSMYPFQCTCTPALRRARIRCDINTKSIHKPRNYWIGTTSTSNGTNDAIVHPHCPYDFCKSGSMNLNLEHPDNQCQYNRSGILCGNCQNSSSLTLGTSQCLQCKNVYLLLIIPFALAGIVVVVILIMCDFTVSVGTINGLIFYANIVRINQEILFPATANGRYSHILTTFIAWWNLDLGIETCFWNGLDAYGKVWLQLIFPVYIWTLIGAIIVLSDRYTTVARLSRRNAVPVLATLFLLSYAKLLRVVVTALAYTTLEYPDGTIVAVWLYDGNVKYMEGKHIPLFLVALAILFFLSTPYTVVLLFAQCLQKNSHSRVLFWVRKMKPLFDSYIGAYKDKHCYWTGLLLVARAVLILVYALTSLGDPAVNLLSTISVVLGLTVVNLAIGGAYKHWILTLLEQSFLLNLCILSAATLYTRQGDGNQAAVAYTSVTVSLVTCAGIFLYHTTIALKNSRWLMRNQDPPPKMVNIVRNDSSSDSEPEEIMPVKRHVLIFDEFRGPVLEHCNND